ncbi:MAG TPA: hypothetical protein PK071_03530 [Atopobiaceae bacterium]|nr:hypothetical protein [Atopobiaceae bacterium]
MSPSVKNFKKTSLLLMILGLVLIVVGIVQCVLDFDVTDAGLVAASVLSTAMGVTGARKANVPSTVKGIVPPALILGILCLVGAALSYVAQAPYPTISYLAVLGANNSTVALYGRTVAKELERV